MKANHQKIKYMLKLNNYRQKDFDPLYFHHVEIAGIMLKCFEIEIVVLYYMNGLIHSMCKTSTNVPKKWINSWNKNVNELKLWFSSKNKFLRKQMGH